MRFRARSLTARFEQMRLNPVNVQNVVTYNVVIDVDNPEQKLKPGMTANLTITIDERNNVLKVPNSALRFTPQDANAAAHWRWCSGQGQGQGQGRRRQQQQGDNAAGGDGGENQLCAGVSASACRVRYASSGCWARTANRSAAGSRLGLSDGSATEVVDGDLKEGDMVITGQTDLGREHALRQRNQHRRDSVTHRDGRRWRPRR